MAAPGDRGVPLSTLCPKFLHTNSTSHTWPFSAIAELIDNAYDPDVSAKQFWIDKTVVKGEECLSFMDNGNGLDHETMHKMLSFGYSDKIAVNGLEPIGIYGNGFKSGSMSLGKDAIVFSNSKSVSCIGMLSQTYLEKIEAKQIIVPIVCFERRESNEFSVREEHKASLEDILRYSPFETQEELLLEIDAISSTYSTRKTGTRIIIWNLRSTSTGTTEFDFKKDRYDIQIPSDMYEGINNPSRHSGVTSCIPESDYSLRAYCSILYLKPRMQIIIRGQKVKSQLIAKSLAYIRKDHYKPTFVPKRVTITFGYNTKSKDQYGIMMYHKNRLIKAYEHVGCQLKANNKGVGVIGVIECNFLDPTHNKQSFIETDKYRKTINSLGVKLEEYWQEIRYKRNAEDPNSLPVEDDTRRPDQNWAQCDECQKWRKLPDGIDSSKLPDKWYCRMNPDPQFRSCQVDEECQDSEDEQPYQKTYKQQEREQKKNQEMKRQKEEEERKRQEEERLVELHKQNQALKKKHKNLKRQLLKKPASTPSTPTTPRSTFNTASTRRGIARGESSTVSPAACSPSSSSGLPVISNVCSMSTGPQRGKRTQHATPQETPKRPKVSGLEETKWFPDTSPSMDGSSLSPPSVPAADDDDDTDDDIFILETGSTPKPQKSFDLAKVKTEKEQSDAGLLLECSDEAALDAASKTNAAGTGCAESAAVGTAPSPAPPGKVASTTTQTELIKVKEEEDQYQTEGKEREGGSSDMDCVEQGVVKQKSSGDSHGENQGKQNLQKKVTDYQDSEDDAGPSGVDAIGAQNSLHHPSMMDVQEQQDQLLELMQATAQERDSFKEQVHKLTCQLQDVQKRLQERSQINVKKECYHQACQTEETEGGKDYKSLFEKAKQKVDELIKDKEAQLATTETKPGSAPDEEEHIDEIALQVDRLVRQLDRITKERDELRSQVDSLEEERANLASQCEELRLSLQQQRENAQKGSTTPHRATDSTAQTDPEEAGGTGMDSSSNTSRSLIELRHNIGRLLISFVPALDLGQVNYECNVIDEILEQVLFDVESVVPVGWSNK
ncbi:MORC family CW-type zinc finger protein 3a [Morone saxatilis]|uniref:MORC family CW-type zinc finger protein 3a n=1 Tax=Morone saxatilis TaxID=34816 RepID=UPI0015E1D31F|nr:MORC family CW-type zinc finger protein 3a [Morone saxatilis]